LNRIVGKSMTWNHSIEIGI